MTPLGSIRFDKQDLKSRVRPAVTIAIVFVVGWFGVQAAAGQWSKWFAKEEKEQFVPTAVVKRGSLTATVKQIGNVEAERSILVSAEIDGKIIYMVPEGQTVQAGQLLVQLDDTPLKDAVTSATLAFKNAQAQVEKAKLEMEILQESNKTDVEQQEAQLNYDKAELERVKKELEKKAGLAEEGLIPRSQVELAQIEVTAKEFAVERGEKTLALKRKEVESKESQKATDVQNVEFQMMMAKSKLDEATTKLGGSRITAPAGGLVVIQKTWTPDGRRKFKEGDAVYPRQQVLQLPDLSSMLVNTQVDEADIARVKVGQRADITLDALPGQKFTGVVQEISNLASEASPWETSSTPGRKNFEVVVKVNTGSSSPLRPGMTANVEIVTDTIPGGLYVPIEAVFEKAGVQVCYVQKGSTYVSRPVVPDKRNDTFITIKSGLKLGEKVALRDPTLDLEETPGEEEDGEAAPIPAPAPVTEKQEPS